MFYGAVQKYGWHHIEHKILYTNLSKDEAIQKEIELIAEYKTTKRNAGYNRTTGGEGSAGAEYTDSHRRKIGAAVRRLWEDNGYRERQIDNLKSAWANEESRAKRINSLKKTWQNEELRQRQRDANAGCNNGFYGRKHTNETKALLAELSRGKCGALHPRSKPILQFSRCGEFIKRHESINLAAKENSISSPNLIKCLKGDTKSAGGFIWKYEQTEVAK